MGYQILVDENTSPRVAETLRGRGHDAIHIHDALKEGADDRSISKYAHEHGYVILTHDDDFLLPEYRKDIAIFYYSDDTLTSYEIADRVDQVTQYVPDPSNLPAITNLGEWEG